MSHLAAEILDVSDPGLYERDAWYEPFARLRRDDPVHFCEDSQFGPYWSVTTYDEILEVELDPATYSSASEVGGIQITDPPSGHERPNFIRMDPPRHTTQRKPIVPMFNSGSMAQLQGLIEARTAEVLDGLPRNETFDWVEHVSVELTTMMLATLFDFPWEDRHLLAYWSDVAIANVDSSDAPIQSETERSEVLAGMGRYFADLWQARAEQEPSFDLVSMLAHGAETRDMHGAEFVGNMGLLIVGGNDTTRNSMSGGLLAMAQFPDELRKLKRDPSLVATLVPEIIRFHTPVIHMRRTTTRATELRDKHIPKGSKVVMWYISGNRDETAIPDANTLDISRKRANRHLSFGAGVHRCVGLRLAELQLRILWQAMLERGIEIEIMGEPTRLYSNFIRGVRSLPVRINA